ncbi:MAG: hypothetical protein H6737_25945 [Alphaproteobacteria bacterium]|nr:hypothetical protein [Alphaproteobacteria bacterium]
MSDTPIANPLVLIGLGAMGTRVVDDLEETAKALYAPRPSPHTALTSAFDKAQRLRRKFADQAGKLMEAGAGRGTGRVNLDVVVVADGREAEPDELIACLDTLTDVLADDFPVLFPPSTPPEQRSVWLTVLLGTPPMVATPEGTAFAKVVAGIDAWAGTARHPALSRVLLLPRQTTAGRLDEDGLEEALRAGVQTLFLSGSRDHDDVRAALAHRPDDRRFASLAVATAELPVARIRRYARWRLALTGLEVLLDLAETPTTDPSRAQSIQQRLDGAALLEDFGKGTAGERVRGRAARLSGAEDHLPDRWRVRITERPVDIRTRYRVLFDAIAKPWNRRTDPTTDPDHGAMLRLVDQAEAGALHEADRRITALLDEELEPQTALRVLPPLEHALKQAIHDLKEELAAEVDPLPSPEPPPPPDDPGLRALERVIDGRPGISRTWGVLAALAGSSGVTVVLLVSWLMAPTPTGAAAAASSTLPPTTTEAWAAGFLVGFLVAAAWQLLVLWIWRHGAELALEKRTHELDEAWRRGGAGQEREQAERLLAVRRRRTARDLVRRYEAALERLAALRAAIRQMTASAKDTLVDLRVRLGQTPRQDDLSGLLGTESALHRALVDPSDLATRLEAIAGQRDAQRWAGQILNATWPRMGGLSEDLPCLDRDALLRTCDDQLGVLTAAGLLGEEREGVQSRAHTFLAEAGGALGWGITPVDAHGDPVRGEGRDRRLLIAPTGMRAAVQASLADAPVLLDPCWTEAQVPWLSIIALWSGLSADDVLRGMGVRR